MAVLIRKCGLFFCPTFSVFTKIIMKNVPWRDLSNFLNAVLEKFVVDHSKSYKNYEKKYKLSYHCWWSSVLIVNNRKFGIAWKNQGNLFPAFWKWLIYQKEPICGAGETPEVSAMKLNHRDLHHDWSIVIFEFF